MIYKGFFAFILLLQNNIKKVLGIIKINYYICFFIFAKYKMNLKPNISKSVIISSLVIFTGIRLLGDTLLFFVKKLDTDPVLFWKSVSTLSIIFSLLALYFYDFIKNGKFSDKPLKENYFKDAAKLLLLSIGLFALNIFQPETVSAYLLEKSLINLIYNDLLALSYLSFSLYLFYMIYKWANLNKNKKTKSILRALNILYVIAFIIEFGNSFLSSGLISTANVFILIASIVLIYMLMNNSNWLATLPKNKKLRSLWLSLSLTVIMILLTVNSIGTDSSVHSSLAYFMDGAWMISGFPFFCGTVLFARIFFSSIGALRMSEIVERKTFEVQSLAYLNRIIANTIEFDNLLRTINQLALNGTGANFAWVEIFNSDKAIDKLYSEQVKHELIESLHTIPEIDSLLLDIKEPILIPSIIEEKETRPYFEAFHFAESIIIVPLFFKMDKIGNLIVLSKEEYGLDLDSLNVLNAFKDNISIAIENAKLLEDSIEKEKYKQEIALAKDMQDKLLPKQIPQHQYYSIAAFTNSAEVVGGDYYDIVTLKNGKTCLLIGDVSGKGISAAFYMAQLKGVVMSQAKESENAAEILRRINSILYGKMDKQMYITLSALVLDNDGTVSFARAGHMPTVIKTSTGITFHQPKGFGVGLVPAKLFDANLEEHSVQLSEADICFMFTDGVNELRDENDEDFGYDHLKHILSTNVFSNADSIIQNMRMQLDNFSKNTKQLDDITIMTVIYKGMNPDNKGIV